MRRHDKRRKLLINGIEPALVFFLLLLLVQPLYGEECNPITDIDCPIVIRLTCDNGCDIGGTFYCSCPGDREPSNVSGNTNKSKPSSRNDDDPFEDDDSFPGERSQEKDESHSSRSSKQSREEEEREQREREEKERQEREKERQVNELIESTSEEIDQVTEVKEKAKQKIQANKEIVRNESSQLTIFSSSSFSSQQETLHFQTTNEAIRSVQQKTGYFDKPSQSTSSLFDSELDSLKKSFLEKQHELLAGTRKSYVDSFRKSLRSALSYQEKVNLLDRVSTDLEILKKINTSIRKSVVPNPFGNHIESLEKEVQSLYNEYSSLGYVAQNNELAKSLFRENSLLRDPSSILGQDIRTAFEESLTMPKSSNTDSELQALTLLLERMALEAGQNSHDIALAYSFLHLSNQLMGFSKGFLRSSGQNISETAQGLGDMTLAIITADNEDVVRFATSTAEGLGYALTNYDKVYEFIKQEVVKQQKILINGTPEEQGVVMGSIVTSTLLLLAGDRVAVNMLKGFRSVGSAITKATYNATGELINTGRISIAGLSSHAERLLKSEGGWIKVLKDIDNSDAINKIERFLGKNPRVFRNKFGNLIMESKDGVRQVRFDTVVSYPHPEVHTHVIEFRFEKNKKVTVSDERIFPSNIKKE